MRWITAAVLCAFLASCSNLKLVEQDTPEGQERFTTKRGSIRHGTYTIWYPNGAKKMEVEYRNGKKNGLETLWDAFGAKLRETTYVNGNKSGKEIFWNHRGVLEKEILLSCRQTEGLETTLQ